jgi:phosphopantothenate---cysteine ligase (CTP)
MFLKRVWQQARFSFMRFLVSCGPTSEPLDQVRRLTNFSTGKLGVELGNFLTRNAHEVTLLQGSAATYQGPRNARPILTFTTIEDLQKRFEELSGHTFHAVFHAAAVSDFKFGKVFTRETDGQLNEIHSGKFATSEGALLAELLPTPKVISQLRALFPAAKLFGWKYEVEGNRESVVALGLRQIAQNRTDYCVLNGPAYGPGYGIASPEGLLQDCISAPALYEALLRLTSAG